MLKSAYNKFKEKSLRERFLFVLGFLFFFLYLVLGLVVIFWDQFFTRTFPIIMEPVYRIALGVVLIVYSFLRFVRFYNSNRD